jgi:hypothetical protein
LNQSTDTRNHIGFGYRENCHKQKYSFQWKEDKHEIDLYFLDTQEDTQKIQDENAESAGAELPMLK